MGVSQSVFSITVSPEPSSSIYIGVLTQGEVVSILEGDGAGDEAGE